MTTTAEKQHMDRVASLGCIMMRLGFALECGGLRGPLEPELHHAREEQGAAQRSSNWLVIPCCTNHHTGPFGIHHRKSFYTRTKFEELDLLAATIEALDMKRNDT